jgi:glycosyltransferase involved in cell wall biosynthesis
MSHNLRVAVISDAAPERNGVGSYYADLVAQLSERIEKAQMFCPRDRSESWQRYLAPPVPGDGTQKVWLPRPFKLRSALERLRPHAIVVPTPGPFGLYGLLLARRMQVPLITGFHTHYEALSDLYWSNLFGRVARRYLSWSNKLLFRHSTAVLAVSPEMSSLAVRMGADSAHLIGTSVPREFLTRPFVPLSPTPGRILFAGRLAEEKNVHKVLELARARPALQVSIAGDGPMRQAVLDAASRTDNLNYLGWVSRDRLIDVFDEHDALLLPSRVESFGTVALEALSRGRPVILSGSCGIAEWPQFDNCLFHIGDDETVAQAVDRVFSLPHVVRAGISQEARRAARDLNDWNLATWIDRLRPE